MESCAYLRVHEFEKARKKAVERDKEKSLFSYISSHMPFSKKMPSLV
jgi:hypothetical protein